MKICIAQIKSIKGNIAANIDKHITFIEIACSFNASSIFFSELSLTGYEPELAKDLATDQNDRRFDKLQLISDLNIITIGAGTPTFTTTGIRISMIIFQPQSQRQSYSKQQLHPDELTYFEKGDRQLIVNIDNKKIAPAICYESLQPDHSDKAITLGAEIYVASVAKSQNGINKAMTHYPLIAKNNSIPVLMSNCVGYCDNFIAAGSSAVWTKSGELVGQLDDTSEGLLIFDTETEEVIKYVI